MTLPAAEPVFADVGGAGGLSWLGSWRRDAPLLHRGSIVEIADPVVGAVDYNEGFPQCSPDRRGELEEAVE